jgi:hypothetical protein
MIEKLKRYHQQHKILNKIVRREYTSIIVQKGACVQAAFGWAGFHES